jgi:hypothetical protein
MAEQGLFLHNPAGSISADRDRAEYYQIVKKKRVIKK